MQTPPLRWTWLVPAFIALISVIGGVAGNLIAAYLETPLQSYRRWVLLSFAITSVIAVVAAIIEHRRRNQPSVSNEATEKPHAINASGKGNIAIGGKAESNVMVTGDKNVVGDKFEGDRNFRDKNIYIQQPAGAAINPLHQLPPPPADFTGRQDELRELLTAIEHGGVTISGLQGLGGIGKTALAVKLAEQLKPRYSDAQLYLDLKGASAQPLTVAEALAHVIRSYHPAAKLPESETELRGLYLSVLEGQRALLLMDNAAGPEQVESLIPPVGCVLLVTSRRHFTLPGLAAKNLDTLTPADARALLLKIAPRISDFADEIATLCGHLPLALRLAAGALAKYVNLKPEAYVQRLQDGQQRLQLIEASLSLSYELLSDELQERWRYLAVFSNSFADDGAAAVWEVAVNQAQDTLGELIAASMVEWNETAGRYRLHDLARLFAEAKLSAAERGDGSKRHATHYRDVLASAENLYLQGGEALARGLALFDLEWSNIQAGHTWLVREDVEGAKSDAELIVAYSDAGVRVLFLRQHSRERIRWLDLALTAAKQLKDQSAEARALGGLGTAYANIGNNERAIEFHEKALIIFRKIGDRWSEGATLGNLGRPYAALGNTQRAIELVEQRLTIARELGDRRGEGYALGNLGNTYAAIGEAQRAIYFNEQSLNILRELGDRRGEGSVLGNLGSVYYDLGEIQRAIQCYKQQLTIVRQIGDRTGEGNALANMSLALDQLGKRTEAIQYAEQSLRIREQIEDPRAANVRAQLAQWSNESGQN